MLTIALLSGCSRENPPQPTPSPSAIPAASAVPSAAPSAPAGPVTWTGSYTATPGTLFVPDGGEWSGVKFRGDDASTGLGAGTLTVTIDATGRIDGTTDGALGTGTVSGLLKEDTFTARIAPKDPNDGFTGTAVGKREGDAIKGQIRLSQSNGSVIREATFSLGKK
jgi:hypothetical protein